MLSTVADQGECAVCSPPQAVAQVMIQSFQLSSCALFNAQMQDVSVHRPSHPPLLHSVSLRLRPMLRHERRIKRDRTVCDGPRYSFIYYFAVVLGVQPTRVSMGDVVLSSCAFAVVPPPSLSLLSVSSHCCRCRVLFSPPPVRQRLTSRLLCRWDL